MTKIFCTLLVLFLLIFAFSPVVHAQDYKTPEIKTLEASEVIDRDYFIAGEQVEIYGTINGDLYAAGGMVIIEGVVNGDVLVGGGEVRIKGEVTQDVRAVGGQVIVSGNIGRNLTIAAGNIDLLDSATIGGNVVTAGGNTTIAAPIAKDITAATGNLVIDSEIGRDVTAAVGTIRLAPNAVVGGNLTYYSEEDANISAGAKVNGETTKKQVPQMVAGSEFEKKPQETSATSKVMGTLYGFLSSLLVGLILVKICPKYLTTSSQVLSKKTWATLGIGFLAMIVTPLAIFFLLITLVGIPVGLILLAAYFLYLYLSKIFVAYWIGDLLMKKTKNKVSAYWVFIAGLAIFTLLTSLPIISGFVWLLTILFGLGAAILAGKKLYEDARVKEVV